MHLLTVDKDKGKNRYSFGGFIRTTKPRNTEYGMIRDDLLSMMRFPAIEFGFKATSWLLGILFAVSSSF